MLTRINLALDLEIRASRQLQIHALVMCLFLVRSAGPKGRHMVGGWEGCVGTNSTRLWYVTDDDRRIDGTRLPGTGDKKTPWGQSGTYFIQPPGQRLHKPLSI